MFSAPENVPAVDKLVNSGRRRRRETLGTPRKTAQNRRKFQDTLVRQMFHAVKALLGPWRSRCVRVGLGTLQQTNASMVKARSRLVKC